MSELMELALQLSERMGYFGILFFMMVESSFVPFPSEAIIPPAAYLASRGQMNLYLIIASGVVGSLVGAVINYFLAFYLGRAIIYRLADHKMSKCFLIDCKKVKKAEDFFLKYGGSSTLIGRLIPVVRQLISLPAGFARMNFFKFTVLTALGSAVWVTTLAFLGYLFGANQELLSRYYKQISLFFAVIALVVISFLVLRRFNRKKNNKNSV